MVQQSIPICLLLSVLGGLLNVLATLSLAYPNHRKETKGVEYSKCFSSLTLACNVFLQFVNSAANVVAAFFGPVSLVMPTIVSSQLSFNMILYGGLGIESFEKTKQVGTFIVMIATIILPVVGPTIQDDQDVIALLAEPYAIVWSSILGLVMLVSGVEVYLQNKREAADRQGLFFWLLGAQVAAGVIGTTASKMFVLVHDGAFGAAMATWILSGAIQTYTIIVQSTEVNQSIFVPALVTTNTMVNAVTGVIIWEDWRVVSSWVGYTCVFLHLAFGNYLLTDFDILGAYQKVREYSSGDEVKEEVGFTAHQSSSSSDEDRVDVGKKAGLVESQCIVADEKTGFTPILDLENHMPVTETADCHPQQNDDCSFDDNDEDGSVIVA